MAVFLHSFSRWISAGVTAGFIAGSASMVLAQMPVVSASLCADSYVLELADPAQIKTLSWQSNSSLSLAPNALRSSNGAWAEAENLLVSAPSLIVLDSADGLAATKLAKKRGSQVFQLSWAEGFADINANRMRLGAYLQKPVQAEQAAEQQNRELLALEARSRNRQHSKRVLYLTPTLGTAGMGTFVDAAIRAAGGINLAAEYGISGWGQLPLERLIANPPDLIVASFFNEGPPSVLQFRSNHSVLRSLRKQVPVTNVSGGYWVCAGPHLILAAEQIADALDKLQGNDRS